MTQKLEVAAERGEKIYRDCYKDELEKSSPGMYVVIDIVGARYFVSATPDEALQEAIKALPDGTFHLIKIGASAAFKVGYSRCGAPKWPQVGGKSLTRA